MRTCSVCNVRAPLCDECVEAAMAHSRGPAWVRGALWGERCRAVLEGPWPAWDAAPEKLRAIARRKIADLAGGDERLTELLARVCAEAAGREYAEPTQRPGGVSFRVR